MINFALLRAIWRRRHELGGRPVDPDCLERLHAVLPPPFVDTFMAIAMYVPFARAEVAVDRKDIVEKYREQHEIGFMFANGNDWVEWIEHAWNPEKLRSGYMLIGFDSEGGSDFCVRRANGTDDLELCRVYYDGWDRDCWSESHDAELIATSFVDVIDHCVLSRTPIE